MTDALVSPERAPRAGARNRQFVTITAAVAAALLGIAAAPPSRAQGPAPGAAFVDARTVDATPRAPLVADAAALPDFAIFRECETCPEMVVLPAGWLRMGSPWRERDRNEDEDDRAGGGGSQVDVTISRFAIGRFEVTRGQYARFSDATDRYARTHCYTDRVNHGSWEQDSRGAWRDPNFAQQDDHPVVCVNFEDAQDYIAWLNAQTSGRYRLPSEAEWEYAARASAATAYPWGADANQGCAYANGVDATARAVYPRWAAMDCDDGALNTAPVGSYLPNAFGLYDMIGNVWEWTDDCYRDSLAGQPPDGRPFRDSVCLFRVARGGSWGEEPRRSRTAMRVLHHPASRGNDGGFRLARSL
jgi:formylglycine-generating enzyme required for sulfatase activity